MPSLTSLKDTWYRTYLPLKNTSSFKRLTKTQAFLKNLKTKDDSKPFTICKKAPSPEFPSSLLQIPLVLPVFNLKSSYYGLLRYLGRPSFSVVLWFILQASLSWIAFCTINFNSWSSVSFFFFLTFGNYSFSIREWIAIFGEYAAESQHAVFLSLVLRQRLKPSNGLCTAFMPDDQLFRGINLGSLDCSRTRKGLKSPGNIQDFFCAFLEDNKFQLDFRNSELDISLSFG